MIKIQSMEIMNRFVGEYMFMRWVINRFKQELPYAGRIDMFALGNQYSEKACFLIFIFSDK